MGFAVSSFRHYSRGVWNSPYVNLHYNPFEVNCQNRNIVDKTLEVGFPGNVTIEIPLGRLVTQLKSGKCVTFISQGIGGDVVAATAINFGAPFLLSIYATFNQMS